jgi:hypothetical protein
MKKLLLTSFAILVSLSSSSIFAGCNTYGAVTSCTDGTTYIKSGSSIYGSNSVTGSNWNQTQIGNTTIGNTNGRSWYKTTTPYATYGTNSYGESFYYPNR